MWKVLSDQNRDGSKLVYRRCFQYLFQGPWSFKSKNNVIFSQKNGRQLCGFRCQKLCSCTPTCSTHSPWFNTQRTFNKSKQRSTELAWTITISGILCIISRVSRFDQLLKRSRCLYPQSRQCAKLYLQSSELGLPHPFTRR